MFHLGHIFGRVDYFYLPLGFSQAGNLPGKFFYLFGFFAAQFFEQRVALVGRNEKFPPFFIKQAKTGALFDFLLVDFAAPERASKLLRQNNPHFV